MAMANGHEASVVAVIPAVKTEPRPTISARKEFCLPFSIASWSNAP